MEFRNSDGTPDLEAISYYDPLTGLRSDQVPAFVDEILSSATPEELNRIEFAYLGRELFNMRRVLLDRTGRAGARRRDMLDPPGRRRDVVIGRMARERIRARPTAGEAESPQAESPKAGGGAVDPRVLDLMEFADTCKDFGARSGGTTPLRERVEYIEWCMRKDPAVPVALPVVVINEFEPPYQTTIMDVANKSRFFKHMTTNAELVFGEDRVANPMFGQNFEQGSAALKGGVPISSQYPAGLGAPCEDCVNAELWCFREGTHLKVLMLEQMATVCKEIRTFFWKERLTFVTDTTSNIVKLLLNLGVVDGVFNKKYRIEYRDTRRGVQVAGLAEAIKTFNDDIRVEWNAVTCDAALMDAAEHGSVLDPRKTGDVFHSDSVARVRLSGAFRTTVARDDTHDDRVEEGDKMGTTDVRVVGYTYEVESAREGLSRSARTVVDGVCVDEGGTRSAANYSKNAMSSHINDQEFLPRGRWTKDSAVNFALKRAGDWGMVEHCAKFNHAFATTDKLAALYARSRGVCMLYLNDHRAERSGFDDDGEERRFLQYSFAMCGSFRSHMALQFYDPKAAPGHGGGGSSLPNVALACVVLACAMLGR